MEKYRIQRRVTGQAYTESAMKDVEGNIDTILEKNINIMRERTGQSTNVDVFFNFFALGECFPEDPAVLESRLIVCKIVSLCRHFPFQKGSWKQEKTMGLSLPFIMPGYICISSDSFPGSTDLTPGL